MSGDAKQRFIDEYKRRQEETPVKSDAQNRFLEKYKGDSETDIATKWIDNYNEVMGKANDFLESSNEYQDASASKQTSNALMKQINDLRNDGEARDFFASQGRESAKQVDEAMRQLHDTKQGLKNTTNYWGQFKSKEEYESSPAYFENTYRNEEDFDEVAEEGAKTSGLKTNEERSKSSREWMLKNSPAAKGWFGENPEFEAKQDINNFVDSFYNTMYGGDLSNEETAMYNYLSSTEGKEKAEAYKESIKSNIDQRTGQKMALDAKDNPIARQGLMLKAGIDSFITDIKQVGKPDALAPTATAFASEYLKKDMDGFERGLYDAGVRITSFLPSMFIGTAITAATGGLGAAPVVANWVGRIAGVATMGTQIGGGAYRMSRIEGKTIEEARTYAIIMAALTSSIQFATSGLYKAGSAGLDALGVLSLDNINSVALKSVAQIGVAGFAGFSSRYVLTAFNPIIRNICFDEHNQFKAFSEDALFAGLQGALMSITFQSGGIIRNNQQEYAAGKALMDSGNAENLVYAAKMSYMEMVKGEKTPKEIRSMMSANKAMVDFANKLDSGKLPKNEMNFGKLDALYSDFLWKAYEVASIIDQMPRGGETKETSEGVNKTADIQEQVIAPQVVADVPENMGVDEAGQPVPTTPIPDNHKFEYNQQEIMKFGFFDKKVIAINEHGVVMDLAKIQFDAPMGDLLTLSELLQPRFIPIFLNNYTMGDDGMSAINAFTSLQASAEKGSSFSVAYNTNPTVTQYYPKEVAERIYRELLNTLAKGEEVPDKVEKIEQQEVATVEEAKEEVTTVEEKPVVRDGLTEEKESYLKGIAEQKASDPSFFWSVDVPDVETMKTATLIEVDGGAGIVTKDGDIKGLYKSDNTKHGVASSMIKKSIKVGGNKLDNFDLPHLTKAYKAEGFKIVSSTPFNAEYAPDGWVESKHGRPDVVAMIHDPKNLLKDIKPKMFPSTDENAYSNMISYRDKLLKDMGKTVIVKKDAKPKEIVYTKKTTVKKVDDAVAKQNKAAVVTQVTKVGKGLLQTKAFTDPKVFANPKTTPLRNKGAKWATISSDKGNATEKVNVSNREKFEASLKKEGFEFIKGAGTWGGDKEVSYLILNIPTKRALAYAREYKQDSFLDINGINFSEDGNIAVGDVNNIEFNGEWDGDYSEITIGGELIKYRIPIDFGDDESVEEPVVELSAKPDANDILRGLTKTEIDKAVFGSKEYYIDDVSTTSEYSLDDLDALMDEYGIETYDFATAMDTDDSDDYDYGDDDYDDDADADMPPDSVIEDGEDKFEQRKKGVTVYFNPPRKLTAYENGTKKILEAVGQKYGVHYILTNRQSDSSLGFHIGHTNTTVIYTDIDPRAYKPIVQVAGHELYHLLRESHPDAAFNIQDKVVKQLMRKDNLESFEKIYKEFESIYTKHTPELNSDGYDDYILREMVSDAFLGYLDNSVFIENLLRENSEESMQSIQKFLKNFLTVVNDIGSRIRGGKEVMNMLGIDFLVDIYEDFSEALKEARNKPLFFQDMGENMAKRIIDKRADEYISQNKPRTYTLVMDKATSPPVGEPKYIMPRRIKDSPEFKSAYELTVKFYAENKVTVPTEKTILELLELLTKRGFSFPKATFVREFKELYATVDKGNVRTAVNLVVKAGSLVENMLLKSVNVDKTLWNQYEPVRKHLAKINMSLSDKQWKAIKGYTKNEYQAQMIGKAPIKDGGISLTEVWKDLTKLAPEMFNSKTKVVDMPNVLIDFFNNISPIAVGLEQRSGMPLDDLIDETTMGLMSDFLELYKQGQPLTAEAIEEINTLKKEVAKLKRDVKRNEDNLSRYIERKARAKFIQEINRASYYFTKALTDPTKSHNVPVVIGKHMADFLSIMNEKGADIPMQKLLKYMRGWEQNRNIPSVISDKGFFDEMQGYIDSLDSGVKLEDMSLEELENLSKMIQRVMGIVKSVNRCYTDKFTDIATPAKLMLKHMQMYDNPMTKIGKIVKSFDTKGGAVSDMFNYMMGDWNSIMVMLGRDFAQLGQALYDGGEKKSLHLIRIRKELEPLREKLNDLYTVAKNTMTFPFPSGDRTMTLGEAMNLYNLGRSEYFFNHSTGLGKGIHWDRTQLSHSRYKNDVEKDKNFKPFSKVSKEDFDILVKHLPQEAKEISDSLRKILNREGGGLDVVLREFFGFSIMKTGGTYWPFFVSDQPVTIGSGGKKGGNILDANFYKDRNPNSTGFLTNGDIFDVFAYQIHRVLSARYYIFGIQDILSVVNYKPLQGMSVKLQLDQTYGKGMFPAIMNVIERLSSGIRGTGSVPIAMKLIGKTKKALVSFNLRVAVQQICQPLLALGILSPKYFSKALVTDPRTIHKALKIYLDNSGVGAMKAMGFYDSFMGVAPKDLLFGFDGDTKMKQIDAKIGHVASISPRTADEVTWSYMSYGLMLQVEAELGHPMWSQENIEEAMRLLRVLVQENQAVYTEMHKIGAQDSKDGLTQTVFAFMGQPSQVVNTFMNGIRRYAEQKEREARGDYSYNKGDFISDTPEKGLFRLAILFLAYAVVNAAMRSGPDATRKDTEGTLVEKYTEELPRNFLDMINPLNYIPYFNVINSLLNGFDATRFDLEGIKYMIYAVQEVAKVIDKEKEVDWEKVGLHTIRAISYFTGQGAYNLIRESKAFRNLIAGVPFKNLSDSDKMLRMYNFINNGEQDKYKEHTDLYLKLNPKKDIDTIYTGLAQIMADNEPIIAQMATLKDPATLDSAQYSANYKRLQELGYPDEAIEKAVSRYQKMQLPKEEPKPKEPSKYEPVTYDKDLLVKELEFGSLKQFQVIYDELLKANHTEASLKSAVTAHFKPKLEKFHKEGNVTEFNKMVKLLVDSKLGYTNRSIYEWFRPKNGKK